MTKDVKPYALALVKPAKQVGWMSRFGKRLDLPIKTDGETITTTCSKTGD